MKITKAITFIGGGNMARSLIKGLILKGYSSHKILVSAPDSKKLRQLQNDFDVNITQDNKSAVSKADIIILAVKPQIMQNVALDLAASIHRDSLIISVAAGICLANLQRWLDSKKIVRSIPNIPASVGAGMTVLYTDQDLAANYKKLAESLFQMVGKTLWIKDENLISSASSLSGSGPAIIFLVIDFLQAAGEELGLTANESKLLTLQTILGSARIANESNLEVTELRRQVTSPGGTTEQAISVLEKGKLKELFTKALTAAKQKSYELANKKNEK